MRHGKTECFKYLRDRYNYRPLTLAGTMKKMVTVLFQDLGLPEDEIQERLFGNRKGTLQLSFYK
jgi:hypothetical protein